jgi:hypothetical protein
VREWIQKGVLGTPCWFAYHTLGPDRYHPSLGNNPYGVGASLARESGGCLFDFPKAPNQIVALLVDGKTVQGLATIAKPNCHIVPDCEYGRYH